MVCTGSIQLSSILQTKELAATMLSRIEVATPMMVFPQTLQCCPLTSHLK